MTTFSICFFMIYSMEFLIFTYNVYNILIFQIMYNLSWGPNNINVFLHFKKQCNMRSYYRHKRKYMAHLKCFFFYFYSAWGLFFFIHSIQNLYYFKEWIVCQVYQKILLCFCSLKMHVVSD